MAAHAHICGKITNKLSLNKVVGSGGQDVVTNFSVSCKDGSQVEFIECTAWGDAARSLQERTQAGTILEIAGRIKNSEWIDKNTQLKNKKTYILVDKFEILEMRSPFQEKLKV